MQETFMECCKKSVKVALVVGTILSLINQTPAILHLSFTGEDLVRIAMNYLVPFSVSTYSRMALIKEQISA